MGRARCRAARGRSARPARRGLRRGAPGRRRAARATSLGTPPSPPDAAERCPRRHRRRRDREAGRATKQAARKTSAATKRTARQARKVSGVAQAEGQIKGAVASEGDLAIARYDSLTAEEIAGRLSDLAQIDLAKVDSYERKHQNRTTVLSRITSLRGHEPWPGSDELTAAEVQAVLSEGDEDRAREVRAYERAHKNRAGVLNATERELTNS